MNKQNISTTWNGYCPESWLKGKTIRMRLNTSDFFESEETGLQICVLKGLQAVILNFRGKGKFKTSPEYADDMDCGELLSPQNTDMPPFNNPAVLFKSSKDIQQYVCKILK